MGDPINPMTRFPGANLRLTIWQSRPRLKGHTFEGKQAHRGQPTASVSRRRPPRGAVAALPEQEPATCQPELRLVNAIQKAACGTRGCGCLPRKKNGTLSDSNGRVILDFVRVGDPEFGGSPYPRSWIQRKRFPAPAQQPTRVSCRLNSCFRWPGSPGVSTSSGWGNPRETLATIYLICVPPQPAVTKRFATLRKCAFRGGMVGDGLIRGV